MSTESPTVAARPRAAAAIIALRLTCALVLVATALATLFLQGRPATSGELVEDAQAGRISRVIVTDDEVLWWTGTVRPWETETPVLFDGQAYVSDRVPELFGRYAFKQHIDVLRRSDRIPTALRVPAVLAAVVAFLLLIAGPEPARANRWAWFWLFSVGRDAAVGVIAFLLLSGPVAGRTPTPRTSDRWDGAKGFGMSILLGIGLLILWLLVRHLVWPASDGTASYDLKPAA